MIVLHKAKRVDNGKEVKGFLTLINKQYHITSINDENCSYLIKYETIEPCTEFTTIEYLIDTIGIDYMACALCLLLVRENTIIEDIHEKRISQEEMKIFNKQVCNNILSFLYAVKSNSVLNLSSILMAYSIRIDQEQWDVPTYIPELFSKEMFEFCFERINNSDHKIFNIKKFNTVMKTIGKLKVKGEFV